ncbi:MAG: prolyl oligopeptidase family serine peptidase [Acidobacteriota bacterium]
MLGREILFLEPPPATARIAYGSGPQHFGDLRLPANAPNRVPLVILIHGGFWRNQVGLDHMGHMGAALAKEGVASWSIEYRRLGDDGGGYPGTFDDVHAACAHVPPLAATYPINLERVITCGFSAGGQLALWIAAEQPLPLRAAISLAGVADLARAHELQLGNNVVHDLLDGSPAQHPARYAQYSPIERLPIPTRQYLLHGDADDICPLELSERYLARAQATHSSARLSGLAGATHFDLIDPASKYWPRVKAVVFAGWGEMLGRLFGHNAVHDTIQYLSRCLIDPVILCARAKS